MSYSLCKLKPQLTESLMYNFDPFTALRLLARRSHHFFQPSTNPFKTLPEYLDSVVQQLAQELPVRK